MPDDEPFSSYASAGVELRNGTTEPKTSDGAAQESNLPSLGFPDLTGFEDETQRAGLHRRVQGI